MTDAATGILEGYCANNIIARDRRQEDGAAWGDIDGDGTSEWICELNRNTHAETMIYCFNMNGQFPADAYWPEYDHSAYPAEDQNRASWLKLKAAGSNSLWFQISESMVQGMTAVGCILLLALALSTGRSMK